MHHFLENIAAVEISTSIVAEIDDEIFIPWEAYQAIYYLSRSYLERSTITKSLQNRYLQLRRQLELAYCLLLIDRNSPLYNRNRVAAIERDLPLLSHADGWETIPSRLPEPISPTQEHSRRALDFLQQPQFIKVLRQLDRRKIILDRRDRLVRSSVCHDNITDTTYAQTSLHLDGKIINCYSEAILERSDRELLLQLHQQSINRGGQYWRSSIEFMLSLIDKGISQSP